MFGGLAVPPFFSSQEQELELGLSQLSVPGNWNWKLSSGTLFVLLILGPWARGRYIILKSPCVGRNIPRKALRLRQQASDRKTQLRAEKR